MNVSNLFMALLTIGICGVAQASFEDSDSSTFKIYNLKGQTIVEKSLTNYEVLRDEESWSPKFILKSKTAERQNFAMDGTVVQSEISLFEIGQAGTKVTGRSLWTKSIQGGDVKGKWQFVASTVFGCCASPNLTTLHRLSDGKALLTYTNDQIYRLSIPNQTALKPRFVSVIDESKSSVTNKNLTQVGSLAYMDSEGQVLDKVFLYLDLPAGWGTDLVDFQAIATDSGKKNEIREEEIELWASDGQARPEAFQGVALEGSFYYEDKEVRFKIPVEGSAFDLKQAQVSPLLIIERAN